MTLQHPFSSVRFASWRVLLFWCAPCVLFSILVPGLVGRPSMAQDTSIQFASLDSLTADTTETKTRFSLLSIESTYAGGNLRGGALCLVGHGPGLQFPRTFCFYFEEGKSPRRDNDDGYNAGLLSLDDAKRNLNNWQNEVSLGSLPDSVVNLIDSKISGTGDKVFSVRDILQRKTYADRGTTTIDSLSSDLTPTVENANFESFDGIMQAAHTMGAIIPRLRDAQRLPHVRRALEEARRSLSEEANRPDSSRKASSGSDTLIWGIVPVSIWWFIPGVFGFVFGGGLVLLVSQWYVGRRNEEQQKPRVPLTKTNESKPPPDTHSNDLGPGGDGEEESKGEASRERRDQLERSTEDPEDERQTVANEVQALSRESQALANEREALADIRRELSHLAERYERASEIDKMLYDRFREKEDQYGENTNRLLEDLLDLHETVCEIFGVGLVSPNDTKKEAHKLKNEVSKLREKLGGIEEYESKKLSKRIEEIKDKVSKFKSKIMDIGKWTKDIVGQGGDRVIDPVARSREQLRKVMEAASNGKQISTLGALLQKVKELRADAARTSKIEEKVSSLEQELGSVRDEKDGLKREMEDLKQELESIGREKDNIEECLDLMCDKISIDPADKSRESWSEDFRRRLEKYSDNHWEALLGISASLLTFDKAKSGTGNDEALLDELNISDLENELRSFSKGLEHSNIQEMIPNAFSDGWLHTLFRAKAVVDAYFQDDLPEIKDAIDQAESVMRTLLHRIDGDYHTISLPVSLDDHPLPGGSPETDHGSSILDLPGIEEKIKSVYEEKGGRIAYDIRTFPHQYDESGFKHATVYVASLSWLTS